MNITDQLKAILKNPPYAYQTRVAQALLEGKNVILRAPTGAGKTEAALAPYLLARATAHQTFPLKAMLACPMKTLAKSIHSRAQKLAPQLDVRLHTGEDQGAPLLEGDIIVTTIDQLMSNYAHIPLSMSNGRANIGAGAVISSYIVFDEFHLHDPKRAFRTALEMIRELRGVAPFLLMTATLSSQMVQELAKVCSAVVIEPTPEELLEMPSQNKTRIFKRHQKELKADDVVTLHERRSLAICNTVSRAQALFEGLQQIKNASDQVLRDNPAWQPLHEKLKHTQLEQIHSQFFPSDRAAKELQLEAWMGEKSKNSNIILVATQAIEVGINISSEHLHSELCPANSLLQRAGRCARFTGEVGTVHVYDLPFDEKSNRRILPYKEQASEIETTWATLEDLHEKEVDFAAEAALIDAVHTTRDKAHLLDAINNRHMIQEHLRTARRGARSAASLLIREVLSQSVILHSHPEELNTWRKVSGFEIVGVYPGKLTPILASATDAWGEIDGWVAKIPKETNGEYGTVLNWEPCNDPQLLREAVLIVVNPEKVFYSPSQGLRPDLRPTETYSSPPKKSKLQGERNEYWYTFETYRQHIENVMNAFVKQVPEVLLAGTKLEIQFGLPKGTMLHCFKVAIAAHDIGKLSQGWQGWSRAWQLSQLERYPDLLWNGLEGKWRVTSQPKGVFSAHTDYHPKVPDRPEIDDEARDKTFPKKRPSHAAQSAVVLEQAYCETFLSRIDNDGLGAQLFSGIYGAIVRHHGAYSTGECEAWRFDDDAALEAAQVFADLTDDRLDTVKLQYLQQKQIPNAEPEGVMPNPANLLEWLAYSLIARALRQADSNSFVRHEGGHLEE